MSVENCQRLCGEGRESKRRREWGCSSNLDCTGQARHGVGVWVHLGDYEWAAWNLEEQTRTGVRLR